MTYRIPLSPYAKILVNDWKINPLRSDYNIVFNYIIEGELDKASLNRAIQRIISDYVILNSHIEENFENIFLVKNKNFHQMTYFDKALSASKLKYYAKEPFDLRLGPLYRFALIKHERTKHRLIIVLHHLLIDGSSMDFFCHELSNYYNSNTHHASISIEVQKEKLRLLSQTLNERLESLTPKSISFWKRKLIHAEAINLNFLKATSSTNQRTNRTAISNNTAVSEIRFSFEKSVYLKLDQIKIDSSISPYFFSQSIFALLLKKMSGQKHFCISYPLHIKEGTGLLYGSQINLSIMVYDFNKVETFNELLDSVKKQIHSLKGHNSNAYLPITDILTGQDKQLINCCFAQTNLKDTPLSFKETKTIACPGMNIDLLMDLLFELEIKNEKLNFRVKYKTRKFDRSLIHQFTILYQNVFLEILGDFTNKQYKRKLDTYSILSQKQIKQLTIDWNRTKTRHLNNTTIHQLFEKQVLKTPKNTALKYKDTTLSYRELNEKANQLAHHLKEQYQVHTGSLVAILLERNENMLIAIFAILKTGAAYVPIEPNYPKARIEYILKDTKAKLILTNESNKNKIGDLINATIFSIDNHYIEQSLSIQPKSNLKTLTTAQDLAYVIYTSGTTGDPKGVMIEHAGVVNRIRWMNKQYPLSIKDKILQKTPYTFDVSVWEFFWATWYGASILIAEPDGHKDLEYLIRLIYDEEISIVHFVPSLLNSFIKELQRNLSRLRHIFCSGETLSLKLAKLCQKALPHVLIHNLYGPTEASIDVLYYDYHSKSKNIYIGKPIDNTSCYILTEDLSPSPIGVSGELYIGGIGVARGYLNKENLTNNLFIGNPFQTNIEKHYNKNAKLYKTGDFARWLPNGVIEYLGRKDFQVKIRGHRIELHEIEAIWSDHPDVTLCAVVVKERHVDKKSDNEQFLVGYYTCSKDISEEKIYQHLRSRLPEYMLPNLILKLTKFPIMHNGKIDRQALKALKTPNKKSKKLIPRTELELAIRKIYMNILNISHKNIGVNDDFFQIGGDSILSIKLISILNSTFKSSITVKDIYEFKSIKNIANAINTKLRTYKSEERYLPFSLADRKNHMQLFPNTNIIEDIYPASQLQSGMLIESMINQDGTYHDVFVYHIASKYHDKRLSLIWKQLTQKHALLRAAFFLTDKGFYTAIYKDTEIDIQIYKNQNIKKLIHDEITNHFNFEKPGLFRIYINETGPNSFELVFSFHHAIADGWSVASLIKNFIELYMDKNLVLKNINLSYGEFVLNELNAVKDDQAIPFWKGYLHNAVITKAQWKNKKEKSRNGLFTLTTPLDTKTVKSIHKTVKKLRLSVDTIFLGAYIKMLSELLHIHDLTVGLVVNNRLEKKHGEELFGLFLNTIPFRFDLSKHSSTSNILQNIFNRQIELKKHQKIPYAQIKKYLKLKPYGFGFSFIHFHGLNDHLIDPTSFIGYEKTSIPFSLSIFQYTTTGFYIRMSVHDKYIDTTFLNKVMKQYVSHIEIILIEANLM